MTAERVWFEFLRHFPDMKSQVEKFYMVNTRKGSGDHAIKLFLKNHNTLLFTLHSDKTWKLEKG